MPLSETERIIWQEDSNCQHYTNMKMKCSICGEEKERVVQFMDPETEQDIIGCHLEDSACMHAAMRILFSKSSNPEYIMARGIEYKPIGTAVRKKKKREPIGLSKRYKVMSNDGFQCAICGNSGIQARLEIDHIVPVSKGGSNKMENLRTLCFECNRGKGNKTEQ